MRWLAMLARRVAASAGGTKPASRRWWPRWSTPISSLWRRKSGAMVGEVIYPIAGKRVWVAGHGGLVGQALLRRLAREDCDILTVSRAQVDLRRQAEVERWIDAARPDAILLAAGTVGGILANSTRPA